MSGAEHKCKTGYHKQPALGCYTNHWCRCAGCREAHTDYQRRWRATVEPSDAAQHGVRPTYVNYGCRCEPCREAEAAHHAGRP